MNTQEFNQITRDYLIEDWGDKNYSTKALSRLWRLVGQISASEFRYALEQLSLTAQRAPNLGQIKGACQPAIAKANEDLKRLRLKELAGDKPCLNCGNSGWVFAVPMDDWTKEVAFICSCEAAKVIGITTSRNAQPWTPERATAFFMRRHTMPSALEATRMQDEAFAKLRGDIHASEIRDIKRRAKKAQEDGQGPASGLIEIIEEEIPY